jgi:hypothetical protein
MNTLTRVSYKAEADTKALSLLQICSKPPVDLVSGRDKHSRLFCSSLLFLTKQFLVRFEIFTAVTMRNGAFYNAPCGSCKKRRLGGTDEGSVTFLRNVGS